MTLRVVGAGLARTGTTSLKVALEQLLPGHCYHMLDVFENPQHIAVWHDAIRGDPPDWDRFLAGCDAAVDLPASAFWQELAALSPEAVIILSVRESAEQWWESVRGTILKAASATPPPGSQMADYLAMATDIFRLRLGAPDMSDRNGMIAAYERHNDAVRAHAPRERLVEWQAADGWEPIAAALGLPAPGQPFPRVNTRDQFLMPQFGEKMTFGG